MNHEALYRSMRRVEFAETDMAGIVHFTNFFRYMEETEHGFLRERGLSVVLEDAKGKLGFPKLSATCQYKRPARYEELLHIETRVQCHDGKSLAYHFRFHTGDETLAEGETRVAFCRFPADSVPYAIPIPDELLAQLFELPKTDSQFPSS